MGRVIKLSDYVESQRADAHKEYSDRLRRVAEFEEQGKLHFARTLIKDTGAVRARLKKFEDIQRRVGRLKTFKATRANKINIDIWDGSIT